MTVQHRNSKAGAETHGRFDEIDGVGHGIGRRGVAAHANPWSVYSRYSALPLLILAIWARVWIGGWLLLPIALTLVWIRINPHVFAPPTSTRSWASRAVMGEQVWLNRADLPIPVEHARWALGLALLSGAGLPPLIWGLWDLSVFWTVLGATLVIGGKTWFLDQMVRLYDEMAQDHPRYAAWLR